MGSANTTGSRWGFEKQNIICCAGFFLKTIFFVEKKYVRKSFFFFFFFSSDVEHGPLGPERFGQTGSN